MVVVHSVHSWLPRTQTWLYNQIRFLPPAVESHVVARRIDSAEAFPWPRLAAPSAHRAARLGGRVLRRLGLRDHADFLRERLEAVGGEILHSHFGNIGWEDRAAANGLPQVVTFYGVDVNHLPRVEPAWSERYRELFASVSRVLCEGPHMGRCVAELGCPAEKIRVHHLGVEVDRLEFRPRRRSPDEPLRVLIAASFTEKKGIPYALRALGMLGKEMPIQVTVIGDAGPEERFQQAKTEIRAAAAASGLGERVSFLGYRSHEELFAEAYAHHVFASPSVTAADGDTEGGAPVSLIEMAASGMPVVATTHCDIPEVLQGESARYLTAERDVDGLVDCFRRLVALNDWLPLLQGARAHVEREFDVRRQSVRLAAIYDELRTG